MFKWIDVALTLVSPEERDKIYKKQIISMNHQLPEYIQVRILENEEIQMLKKCEFAEITESREGRIIITDSGELAHCLAEQEECVIALLHSGNVGENFVSCGYAVESLNNLDFDYFVKVYQRHCGEPWNILQTKRCILRETTLQDVTEFYNIYSDPEITKYMEDLCPKEEDELQYIKDYIERIYKFYGYGLWTIVEKTTGKVIGRAGLSHREGYETVELGFVIGTSWQRKGLAEEVCRAILDYAEKDLFFTTVQALVKEPNLASVSLCRKLGFSFKETVSEKGEVYERYEWEAPKAMIVTVTLNPALDKTMEVDSLSVGSLNRVQQTHVNVGGKGINVSMTLKKLGIDSLAMGIVGGETGKIILSELEKEGIRHDFCYVQEESRTNIKIIDREGRLTELNENGPRILTQQIEELYHKIEQMANGNTIFILSGSVPPGVKKSVYGELITLVKKKQGRVILDASGDLLSMGIDCGPEIIKPNREELISYLDLPSDCSRELLKEKAMSLFEKGIYYILLTLGQEGAYFLSKEECCYCPPLPVVVESTVGAGDAVAAGWAYALQEQLNFQEAVRLSMALAGGAVMTKGTRPPNKEQVEELKKLVTMVSLNN